MASFVLGTVGTAIGGPIGGFIGSSIGSVIDSYLFAPSPPEIEGPRVTDRATVRADPGEIIPIVYGGDVVPGSLVYATPLIETRHKKKVKGGKGAGGGGATQISFTYHADLHWLLCEGPILGIGRIWADGKLIRGLWRQFEDRSVQANNFPLNMAGIQYPSRYRSATYDPKLVPPTLTRNSNGNADGNLYERTGTDTFAIVAAADRLTKLRAGTIVYWRDSVSGYYIPLPGSHHITLTEMANEVVVESNVQSSNIDQSGNVDFVGGNAESANGQSVDNTRVSNSPQGEYEQTGDAETTAGTPGYTSFDEAENVEPDKIVRRFFTAYHNLYDSINDVSDRSVWRHRDIRRLRVMPGAADQPADAFLAASSNKTQPGYRFRACVQMQRLELANYGNRIPQMRFEVFQSETQSFKGIITDMFSRAGYPSSDYDLSAFAATNNVIPSEEEFVLGYTISRQTSFRACIEKLIDAYAVAVGEVNGVLTFRYKDRATDYAIDYNDMAARPLDAEILDVVTTRIRSVDILPARITALYRDVEREYQQNSANYIRQNLPLDGAGQPSTVQSSSIDTGLVARPSFVKRYVKLKMIELWRNKNIVKFTVAPKYWYINTSDIITFTTAKGIVQRCIVSNVKRGLNGLVEVTALQKGAAQYVPVAGETDNYEADNFYPEIVSPGLTGFTDLRLMDIPAIRPQDDQFGFYYAASGLSNNWSGMTGYRSQDGGSTFEPLFTRSLVSTIGKSVDALAFHAAPIIDLTNTVRVALSDSSETLTSITEAQFQNVDDNIALLGQEIIQFRVATLVSAGVYDLSVLKRGRFGTDSTAQLGNHQINENFAVLAEDDIETFEDQIARIGTLLPYKGVSIGDPIVSTPSQNFTNTGQRLKPYSPVSIHGVRDGSNNLTISWVRRNRFYNNWQNGTDVPNSEDILQFEVEILNAAMTAVIRTIVVNNAVFTLYTAAQQTTDGLTPGGAVNVRIYQMSAIIGRGNPGEQTV